MSSPRARGSGPILRYGMPVLVIGDELRGLRTGAGLTQGELATQLGLEPSAISHIETGRRHPGFGVLLRWLHVCGGRLIIEGPQGHDPLIALGDPERRLVLVVRALEPADRDRLLRVAAAFAELPAEARPLVAEQLELQVRMMKARV